MAARTGLWLTLPLVLLACASYTAPWDRGPGGNPLTGAVANAQTPSDWAEIEQNIVAEHNRVRQNPASYIPLLQARLDSMNAAGHIPNGCGPNCTLTTQEGRAAVQEAIDFLRQQAPLPALAMAGPVAQAARVHAQDQAGGAIGHRGSDGSSHSQRLDRAGAIYTRSGENIAYGSRTGQQVVMDLIIDDGVPDRGHRTNIFSPHWTHIGAGCGPHRGYRSVCVVNYTASSSQLQVIHNGTVSLQSLQLGDINLLGQPLAPGQRQTITLSPQQCQASLRLQLGGNYNPLDWNDLRLCGATLTINRRNGFQLSY